MRAILAQAIDAAYRFSVFKSLIADIRLWQSDALLTEIAAIPDFQA